ncbi:hypothetical protein B0H65DRAFT_125899 [Neurospora tetraspora]|uniref:Uncharacterized protein n=1 Tax=Neurospora tetraspora TaxID=94610 RepID=A0AAE0JLE9_9PEZI|nr:hypothetical protein B0H65DRAFT_125899 [Neurospora tetraspora]
MTYVWSKGLGEWSTTERITMINLTSLYVIFNSPCKPSVWLHRSLGHTKDRLPCTQSCIEVCLRYQPRYFLATLFLTYVWPTSNSLVSVEPSLFTVNTALGHLSWDLVLDARFIYPGEAKAHEEVRRAEYQTSRKKLVGDANLRYG